MPMFENYGQYARDVIDAAKSMSYERAVWFVKVVAGSITAVIACTFAAVCGSQALAYAEMESAIESVGETISGQAIEVQVCADNDDMSPAALLTDGDGLTESDEAVISEQIKSAITPEALSEASATMDGETLEIEVDAGGVPVTVRMSRGEDGTYEIEQVVATIDPDQAAEKRDELSRPITNDDQKAQYASPLFDFEEVYILPDGDKSNNMGDDEKRAAYEQGFEVLTDGVVLRIPEDWEKNDDDNSDSTAAGDSNNEANTDESASIVEDTMVQDGNQNPEKETSDRVKPYAFSYRTTNDETGSTSLSVRAEDLGAAFTAMNGLDGTQKMLDYWVETAKSVAEGAKQEVKKDTDYQTEIFYDEKSGMWGYFGRVELTDGTRDVVYNKAVLVDELADQTITVSYRHDSAAGAGDSLDFETFKTLICHSPKNPAEVSSLPGNGAMVPTTGVLPEPMAKITEQSDNSAPDNIASNGAGIDVAISENSSNSPSAGIASGEQIEPDPIAYEVYLEKLRQIRILPGQSMTEPEREALAAAEAEQESELRSEEMATSEISANSNSDNEVNKSPRSPQTYRKL